MNESSRANDHFDTEEEFNEMLEKAEENARDGAEQNFVDDLARKVMEYGGETFLSTAQYEWLKKIAER